MFNLSSFSSIIPFVILAITYFAGLTTYSISLAQSKLEHKDTSAKSISIEQDEHLSISNESYFHIENEAYFETEKQNTYISAYILKLVKQQILSSGPPYNSENFERSLYMRPPPSIIFFLA